MKPVGLVASLSLICGCVLGEGDLPGLDEGSGAAEEHTASGGSEGSSGNTTSQGTSADASSESDASSGEPQTTTGDDETSGGPPPGTILFAADFDVGAEPIHGFSYEMTTAGHGSHEALAGAGPSGEDVCEFHVLPNEESFQPYLGWSAQELPATPMGEARYIRLLFRIEAPCDGVGRDDVWGDKFIILGDGTPDPWGGIGRVIVMLDSPDGSMMRTHIWRNIDGPEHGTESVLLECGQWHWLQWEVEPSSTLDAEDGGFKFWVDGDNASYDAPTEVSPRFVLASMDDTGMSVWNNINLGFFAQTSLASGTIDFQFAAFEYGTEFDPSWHE